MNKITLRWKGPFSLLPLVARPEIYSAPDSGVPGVYLWAIQQDKTYLVNYVGIAAYNVASRQDDHMRLYLSGKYTIYDPHEFAQARKVVIFDPREGLSAFLSRYDELSAALLKHVGCIHLFFAPIASEKVMLERIESSIIEALKGAGGRVENFLDNFRISRWVPEEQRISVAVAGSPSFQGLPHELQV